MRALKVFLTVHTRRRLPRVNGVFTLHSFSLKAILASIFDALGYTDAIRVVATAPVSNLYTERWTESPAPWRDDVANETVAAGGTAKVLKGYFYISFDKRVLDALQAARGYSVDAGLYAGVVHSVNVVDVYGNVAHWQTLLVNPPTADRVECRDNEAKVCHITPEGTLCACQPMTWSGRPPRTLRVETIYGVVENPPAEFPGFETRPRRAERRPRRPKRR